MNLFSTKYKDLVIKHFALPFHCQQTFAYTLQRREQSLVFLNCKVTHFLLICKPQLRKNFRNFPIFDLFSVSTLPNHKQIAITLLMFSQLQYRRE
jgi:hypothetical protein